MHNWMTKITVDTSFLVFCAFLFVLLPLRWSAAAAMSAVLHELGHITMIYLCQERMIHVKISLSGIVLQTNAMVLWKEILCAAGGPFVSLILIILFSPHFPEMAVCAFVQFTFNILPIYPLDGGRILTCAARLLFGDKKSETICTFFQWSTIAIITGFLIYAWITTRQWGILVIPAVGILRLLRVKTPCKVLTQRLQ